jgi:hypothetical protein
MDGLRKAATLLLWLRVKPGTSGKETKSADHFDRYLINSFMMTVIITAEY